MLNAIHSVMLHSMGECLRTPCTRVSYAVIADRLVWRNVPPRRSARRGGARVVILITISVCSPYAKMVTSPVVNDSRIRDVNDYLNVHEN